MDNTYVIKKKKSPKYCHGFMLNLEKKTPNQPMNLFYVSVTCFMRYLLIESAWKNNASALARAFACMHRLQGVAFRSQITEILGQ